MSERRVCRLLNLRRSTYYYDPHPREDRPVRARLIELAHARPRYGYERLWILLRREGWKDARSRIHRIYKEETLFVRTKPKRRRKIIAQLRVPPPTPKKLNEVWTMDFMHDQLACGRKIRTLNLVDKLSRESLAIEVDYSLQSKRVIDVLNHVASERGYPEVICVDNGSEFTSNAMEQWAYMKEVKIHFIRPGKPTENGHIEAFNRRFRDECLDVNAFSSLQHARNEIEKWRIDYNEWRPHTSIGNLTPKEFAKRKMNQKTA